MTKLFAAVALLATVAAPAFAGETTPTRTFTRDGQTYVYTSTVKGDTTVLTGRSYPSGGDFKLTVRGNHVNGRAAGVPVSFVADSVPTGAGTVTAAR